MNTHQGVGPPTVFNQNTFYGRFRHFAAITDPRLVFVPTKRLIESKELLNGYRSGHERNVDPSQLYHAQKLYNSAFHPDTGELQNVAGRMCFNVYGSTLLCGGMMIFYRSNFGVFFWQWANQSFNALVNYTNRNAKSTLSNSDILVAYTSAVTGALSVAFGLKHYFAKKSFGASAQRLVPLAAVAVANFINIPLMRQNELKQGLAVCDQNGKEVGRSKTAAAKAIALVALSRNIIVAPSMLLTPFIVDWLSAKSIWVRRNIRYVNTPLQLGLVFVLFGAMVPVGCALFPQTNSISANTLRRMEPELAQKLDTLHVKEVYFNKGL